MKIIPKISKKTFQKEGKWIQKPTQTIVWLCVCGNKYIRTREAQIVCLKCSAPVLVGNRRI